MKAEPISPLPGTQYFAGEIRAELARRGWTQTFLAEVIGETQGWVSRRLGLRPVSPITLDDALRMCAVLDLDIADVLSGEMEEERRADDVSASIRDRRRAPRRAPSRQRKREPMWITAGRAGDERTCREHEADRPESERVLTRLRAA